MPPKYGFLDSGNFSEGLAEVSNGQGGYIDTAGKIAIPMVFFQTGQTGKFSEGIAHVSPTPGVWGFIDKAGKMVVPAIYDFHVTSMKVWLASRKQVSTVLLTGTETPLFHCSISKLLIFPRDSRPQS